MKALYIFPHPDDESFGPAVAISKQIREGHEISLLTLTRGEASKIRFDLGISKEELGEIRTREMEEVKKVLNLSNFTILDLPDSGLKEIDPRIIEKSIKDHILELKPDVLVSYPVHGISGFHDHLITHYAVKRVFEELKDESYSPKRLALYTLSKSDADKSTHFKLSSSNENEIDCIEECSDEDMNKNLLSLDCYKTYKSVIEASGIKNLINKNVSFEFYKEEFKPPCKSIFNGL